jgi:hypothetical protein
MLGMKEWTNNNCLEPDAFYKIAYPEAIHS